MSPEGAALEIPFRLVLDLTRADPDDLGRVAERLSAGLGLDAVLAEIIGETVVGSASPPDEARVERRLAGLGLEPGSLTLGPARAAVERAHPLREAYQGPPWPVLIIGIDSADWDLMGPLIDSGDLVTLKELRDRGAWGTLRSMRPTLSPILWTTLATGRRPEDHGVIDFLMVDPTTGGEVPISRLFRRVKALWNITSDLSIPSLTVAWWATWPAERVYGQMVTDRVAYSLFDIPASEELIGLTYPESLLESIGDLLVDESSVTYEDIRGIVSIPRERFEAARAVLDAPAGYRDPISHLIKVVASTRSYHNLAMKLMAEHHPGLTMVYFEGLDEVNHRFAHYLPPTMSLVEEQEPALREAYGKAVSRFYRLQDRLVAELVQAAGPDAAVVIVSDHGFANGAERPVDMPPDIEGKPGRWHTLDGVLIAAGPPIRPGRMEMTAELLDITPTILALMGLPVAEDMPGRVLTEILGMGVPDPPDIRVTSYEQIGEPLRSLAEEASSATDPEMIAKLRALGYLQSDAGGGGAGTTPTYHINAGRLFLENNDLERARREFARAREMAPNFDQALLGLAEVEIRRGRPEEALPLLEKVLGETDAPQPALLTRSARVYAVAGLHGRGIQFLESLDLAGRHEAFRLAAVGILKESTEDHEGAIASYEEALRLDPAVGQALQGLYRLMREGNDLERLAAILERSVHVESVHLSVLAANWLALTRERQGRTPEAREILSMAREKSPGDVMTLTNLGSMLVREDRAVEGLPYLERAYGRQPENIQIIVNLIVAHGKLSNLDRAREYFTLGEEIARPEEAGHLDNAIAYACFLNGEMKEAAEHIERSLARDPSQKEALRLRQSIQGAAGEG